MGVECGQDQAGAPCRVGRVMERRLFFPVQPGRSCHTHTSTHGHTHVCAHAMHTCTHMCAHRHTCAHTRTHMHAHTHACTHTQCTHGHTGTHARTRVHTHAHMPHTRVRTHVHTCTHEHTLVHTHVCTHRHTHAHAHTPICVSLHLRDRPCFGSFRHPDVRHTGESAVLRPPGPGAPLSSQFSVEAAGRGSLPRKRPASSCAANDLISCSPWRAAVFHSRQWDANTRRGPRIKPSEAGFLPEREIGRAVWSSDVGLRGPRGPRDSIFPVSPRR